MYRPPEPASPIPARSECGHCGSWELRDSPESGVWRCRLEDLGRYLAPVNKVVDDHNNPDPACVDYWNYLGCLPPASTLQPTSGIVLVHTSLVCTSPSVRVH